MYNIIAICAFALAVVLSGFTRGLSTAATTTQTAEYSASVTSHAAVFVFVITPCMMILLPHILQRAVHIQKNLASRSFVYLLPALVVVLFPILTVNSGWTFYQPLVAIVCREINVNLLVTMVGVATVCFLIYIVYSVRDNSTGPSSRPVAALKLGHVFGLFVAPLLLVALGSLLLDRVAGVSLFDYPSGSPVIYETMFWVFGHPEVYLLTLPFVGL